MKLKIIKLNSELYIIDVEAKIKEGDLIFWKDPDSETNFLHVIKKFTDNTHIQIPSSNEFGYGDWNLEYAYKVIATPEQLDINNLFEKWLEIEAYKTTEKETGNCFVTNEDYTKGYLQAKKETPFSESDLIKVMLIKHEGLSVEYVIQQLKALKIPECEVEIEMEEVFKQTEFGMPNINIHNAFPQGTYISKPKFTNGKITVTKIQL